MCLLMLNSKTMKEVKWFYGALEQMNKQWCVLWSHEWSNLLNFYKFNKWEWNKNHNKEHLQE